MRASDCTGAQPWQYSPTEFAAYEGDTFTCTTQASTILHGQNRPLTSGLDHGRGYIYFGLREETMNGPEIPMNQFFKKSALRLFMDHDKWHAGSWSASAPAGHTCSSSYFGGDPHPYKRKKCYCGVIKNDVGCCGSANYYLHSSARGCIHTHTPPHSHSPHVHQPHTHRPHTHSPMSCSGNCIYTYSSSPCGTPYYAATEGETFTCTQNVYPELNRGTDHGPGYILIGRRYIYQGGTVANAQQTLQMGIHKSELFGADSFHGPHTCARQRP